MDGKEDGIQVVYKDETIWATKKAMATLFDVGVPVISKHLKNIFESGELNKSMTISKMETVILFSPLTLKPYQRGHIAPFFIPLRNHPLHPPSPISPNFPLITQFFQKIEKFFSGDLRYRTPDIEFCRVNLLKQRLWIR